MKAFRGVLIKLFVLLFALILVIVILVPSTERQEVNRGNNEICYENANSIAIYNDILHLLREETTAECSAIINDGYTIIAIVPISDRETKYTKTNGVWIFYQY